MDVAWLSAPQRRNGEPTTRTTRGRGKVRWQVTAADLKKLERLRLRARGGTHSFEIRVKQGPGAKRWIPVKTSFEGVARGTRASRLVAKMSDGGRGWHLQVARLGRLVVVGRLLESLAHDLTQPLTAILSNAQAGQRLLSGEQASAEEMRGILTDIVSADTHANALIQKIRAHLKRRATKLEYVKLSDAIRDATDFVSGELAAHRVEVATDIEPDVSAVRADKAELEHVLLNLLLNAMQAMSRTQRRRRRVLIGVRRAGAMVEITVEDAGEGLESSQLARVFDPFYTTRKDGLGLGLWLCKTIVTAHRGRIWVTRNVRAGITVHFTLRPYRTVATRRLRQHARPAATIRASREAIARE